MEIEADPQPSSACLTYGTSSQIPALSWGPVRADGPRKKSRNRPSTIRLIRMMNDSKLRVLAERERQNNDGERDQDNPQQIAVRNASRGKITLRLARPLGQFGKVFIAELADGFIDFLIVEVCGFQRFMRLVGRKKRSNGFFVGLARLGGPRGVFGQVAQRNDMLLVLGPRRRYRYTKQKGNRQHRHTHLHAKMHSSSYFWLGRIVYELHCGVTRNFLTNVLRGQSSLIVRQSLCRQGLLVLRGVDRFPLTLDNAGSNLRGALPFAGL